MSLFNNLADFRLAMQVNPDVVVLMDIIFHESSQDGIEIMKEIQQGRNTPVSIIFVALCLQ
jgi:chemotaxis response regulator CheB